MGPARLQYVLALSPNAIATGMPSCPPLQSLPPEVREAKFVGLAALRAEMYDRNLQVQRPW